jgi:hypothetical protein
LKGIPERERLQVKDRDIFQRVVMTSEGTSQSLDPKDWTEPQNRYVIAANLFRRKLKGLSDEYRVDVTKFLIQKCVVICLQADNFEEAFRLFEIVNDRGKQLRRIDVLKAYNLSPDVVAFDTVRDQLATQWENNEDTVGESAFEDIFFLMRLIYVKDKPQGDLVSEFKDRIFKKGILKAGEGFIHELNEYVELYRSIFLDRDYLEESADDIKFRSLMFIMNMEFKASEWRACVLFFARKFGREHLYSFCLKIEKLFLTHWISGVRKDERYEDYTNVLNLIGASKIAESIFDSIPGDIDSVKEAVSKSDLYGKGYAKYVLLRLELAAAEFDHAREFTAKSIEHVFPQNPSEGGHWSSLASADDRKGFVDKVGNLVLLNGSRNAAAGNKEFSDKKKTYLAKRVSDYPRSVEVLAYEEWNPEVIASRTKEAAEKLIADP